MITPSGGTRRSLALLAFVAMLSLAVGACVPTGERPHLVEEDSAEAAEFGGIGADLAAIDCPVAGDQFEGFAVAPIAIIDDEGYLVQCVLIADTPELRQRGFSGVPDTGGHAGMIFAFPEDTTGSFWMGNTHMPLTIAFVDNRGVPVSVLDMEPCPDGVDCPSYFPEAAYRWALEVPQGQLEQFGLAGGAYLDPTTLPTPP